VLNRDRGHDETEQGTKQGERFLREAIGAVVVAATLLLLPAAAAAPQLPAPENLNIRIVGTASFQGKQTALIEDVNTNTDSFYKVGDPIYGHKITAIGTDGISLEKLGKRYFVAFTPDAVRARTDETDKKVVVANTYLPSHHSAPLAPNFYLDAPKSTQWDLWTNTAVASLPKTSRTKDLGGRFAMPLASYKRLSSKFGYRRHPIGGGSKMHKGIDLAARPGTKIMAADSGTVRFSGWKGGYGYCIIIDHHNGYSTTYGHCRKLVADTGDNVRRGDYIAEVGSTGASTGPHLHFEIRQKNVPVDPLQYFKGVL
jgi:murein DD-endopeptidase MepM/ murein hydrolase activator NlpD